MDISVVSGTYNRLQYLQKMVASVRVSLGGVHGLRHELVIVDAGSTDGTLEWLKEQPDVRLVEHGTLLGAVRAFNDGAAAAMGDYVVLANDDVEFLGDGVLWAWVFMQTRLDVGMGCFYQDRHLPDKPVSKMHVELMPCAVDGMQASRPYGQVCIVPRRLGDLCGWWGDYLHTYGGDNELSSQIYEAGYRVEPLYRGTGDAPHHLDDPALGCCIHDNAPDDDLRRINNIDGAQDPRAVRGHHPDSWAWGRKWRRRTARGWLVGPEVRPAPTVGFEVARRERIVYLPIFEQGWPVQKEQKRGLREALARRGPVWEIDYVSLGGGAMDEIVRACRTLRPALVLCQLHGPTPVGPAEVREIRARAPGAWLVNWNGDYWPDNLLSEEGIKLARAFDLQLTVNRSVLEEYRKQGINAAYWQIGWEPDGVGHEPGDRCDVVFLANGYSKERRNLVGKLRSLPYSFRLWGNGWPEGWAVGQCTYDFVTACKAYRGARFSIGDSQWPDSGFVSNRVMQALAAGGSALCHQWFRGMEDLGLRDGETCVIWASFDELREKLAHYHSDEEGRRRIAEAGERLALERHSFDRRVEELLAMRPGEGQEEDWR